MRAVGSDAFHFQQGFQSNVIQFPHPLQEHLVPGGALRFQYPPQAPHDIGLQFEDREVTGGQRHQSEPDAVELFIPRTGCFQRAAVDHVEIDLADAGDLEPPAEDRPGVMVRFRDQDHVDVLRTFPYYTAAVDIGRQHPLARGRLPGYGHEFRRADHAAGRAVDHTGLFILFLFGSSGRRQLAVEYLVLAQEPFARRAFGEDIGAVQILVLCYEIPYLDRFGAGERPGALQMEGTLSGQDLDGLFPSEVTGYVAGGGIGEGRRVIPFGRHRRGGDLAGLDQRFQFPGDIHLQLAPALRDDLQGFPVPGTGHPGYRRGRLHRAEFQPVINRGLVHQLQPEPLFLQLQLHYPQEGPRTQGFVRPAAPHDIAVPVLFQFYGRRAVDDLVEALILVTSQPDAGLIRHHVAADIVIFLPAHAFVDGEMDISTLPDHEAHA